MPTTYTVTFVENDSPSDTVETYQLGTSPQDLTLFADLSPTFSNPGHTFTDWNTAANGSGVSYGDGAEYSFASDLELFAQWAAVPMVTATYSGNGGTGSISGESLPSGSTITLPSGTGLSNPGYSFDDWNTASDGNGSAYAPGDSVVLNSDETFYAQWTPAEFLVTFAPNGGSVSPLSADYTTGGTALTLPTPTYAGFTLNGWFNEATGGTLVGLAGASYEPTQSITLYAQWSADQYVITFDPNGGSVNPQTADFVTGGSAVTLPTPTNAGFTFNGWFTEATGGTQVGLAGATYVPTQSVTLYAQWAPSVSSQIAVSIDDGDGATQVLSGSPGATVTLPTSISESNPGFVLTSWNTAANGSGAMYALGQTVTLTSSLTLYPQWTAVGTVVVTFAANGGSGSVSSLSASVGSSVLLPTPSSLVRPGYTLTSWNTAANGSGTSYTPGQSITLSRSLKLYAQWKATPAVLLYGGVGLFAGNSSVLTAALKQQVVHLAMAIKVKGFTRVTLYGYASGTGSKSADRSIGDARASSVAAYLRSELGALHVSGVAISSAGELADGGAKSNSRVEVFVD